MVETSAPTISVEVEVRVMSTPSFWTGPGRRPSTERTLVWTSFSASIGSTLSSKVRTSAARPVEEIEVV